MVQRGGRAVFTTGPARRAKLSPRRIQTSGCPLGSSNTGQNTREILVSLKPHPLPKGAACATVGKPGLRCPAQEILVKGSLQQCCGRRMMPLRWRQSCPHPAYLLPSPCLPSPAAPWSGGIPPVWHSRAIARAGAANASLGCLGFPHRAPAFTSSPQKPRESSALIRNAIIRNVPETRY